jgi:DNA-binding CsgD family transcriptional regulator
VAIVIPWQALARRWRLTPAEARLLAALAAGQDVAGYAGANAIGVGTVRTHLKQIFEKTGHHSQVELVRAVLSDPLMRIHQLRRR